MVGAGHVLTADEEDLDDGFVAVDGESEDVDLGGGRVGGELGLGDSLDGGDLVAELGGALEVEFVGGVGHGRFELLDDGLALAVEEEHGLVDDFLVLIGGAEGGAGGDAAADVVLEAGARVGAGDFLVAGAPGEEFLGQVERGADGFGGGVGAEVAGAVFGDAAGDGDAGPGGVDVDLEVGVVLVVLEADVEEGLVALDQGGFEVEGVLLGVGGDDFELGDAFGEDAGLAFERAGGAEVAADAGFEVGGLADVDDAIGGVAKGVDAWFGGQGGDLRLELGAGLGGVGGHGFRVSNLGCG